jgi:hypothetical protein
VFERVAYRTGRPEVAAFKDFEIVGGETKDRLALRIASADRKHRKVHADDKRLLRNCNRNKHSGENPGCQSMFRTFHDDYGASPTKLSAREKAGK